MQILLSPEQRHRLAHESQATGKPISALIREAIDARYPTVTREERMAAVDFIASSKAEFIPIEELEEIFDSRYDDDYGDLLDAD
ncbi:MAG: hypothetical protein ACRDYA_04720 [Egibacteraceae bacterium]